MNILRTERRKARKDHSCSYCGCKIHAGDMYDLDVVASDGRVYDWKSHILCAEFASKYFDFAFGEYVDQVQFCDTVFEVAIDHYIDTDSASVYDLVIGILDMDAS